MKKDSRYIWYLIDIAVFLLINIFILTRFDINPVIALESLSWPVILVLIVGVYRLTDVITYENVTEVFRVPFMDKKIIEGKETWEISETGFRGFFGTLISCNACMGVWVSMIVLYFYLFLPLPALVFMTIMALTGFERFLSKIYNFLEKRG